MNKEFIMLVGLPGSGKSTWAKQFENKYTILSSDNIRKELYNNEDDQEHNGIVFDVMNRRTISELNLGHSVIYDATNVSRKRRIALLKSIKSRVDDVTFICNIFATPVSLCASRQLLRDRKVPSGVIFKMMKSFQVPYYNEGFDNINIIESNDQYKNVHFLELKDTLDLMRHDNPHHKNESVWEHCEECMNNFNTYINSNIENFNFSTNTSAGINKFGDLSKVALAHDFGKAYTKEFDDQGIAHYYGHANASAYISLCLYGNLESALVDELHMKRFEKDTFDKYISQFPEYIKVVLNWLNIADEACEVK